MIQFLDRDNRKPKAFNRANATVGLATLEVEQAGSDLVVTIKRKHPLQSGRIDYTSLSMTLGEEDWIKLDAWIHFNLNRSVARKAA